MRRASCLPLRAWPLLALAVLAALTALPAQCRRTWSTERTTPGMPRLPSLTVQMQNSVETLSTSRYSCVLGPYRMLDVNPSHLDDTHTPSRQHRTEKEKNNAPAAITWAQKQAVGGQYSDNMHGNVHRKLSNVAMTQVAALGSFHAQTMFFQRKQGYDELWSNANLQDQELE